MERVLQKRDVAIRTPYLIKALIIPFVRVRAVNKSNEINPTTYPQYIIQRNLVPITENGYPFKRIFKTDRVWSLVETFCEIRRFVNGSRFSRIRLRGARARRRVRER